jgi:hypothetical protein
MESKKKKTSAPIKGDIVFFVLFFPKVFYEVKRNEYEDCKMMGSPNLLADDCAWEVLQ